MLPPGLQESATLQLNAEARRLTAAGKNIINLSVGEPDFPPPSSVVQAGQEALQQGFTKYTAVGGIPELKTALCQKLQRQNKIPCSEDQILVTAGAKQALYQAFQVMLQSKDQVLIPKPYWVSYAAQVSLARGIPHFISTKDYLLADDTASMNDSFHLTADQVRSAITPRTKALLVTTPHNPTGAVLRKAELKRIADAALEHNLWLISDEVYEAFIYDQEHVSLASLSNEIRERTITINSFSKTYGLTGMRVGYSCAPAEITKNMGLLQGHSTSNASSVGQKMALAALQLPSNTLKPMIREFAVRRNFMTQRLQEIGFTLKKPEGAFYAFPQLPSGILSSKISSSKISSATFCQKLLQQHHIAAVPGIAFGQENYLRFSYAVSSLHLQEGLDRLEKFVRGFQNSRGSL